MNERINQSLATAHRPRTKTMYDSQFQLLLSFAIFIDIKDIQDIHFILAFIQLLYDNGLTKQTIANYISACKHNYKVFNLQFQVFEHYKVQLLLKSFQINRPLQFRPKGIISVEMLHDIVRSTHILTFPALYKALFLLAYFSFLRISNLVPPTAGSFDLGRHLARGDIVWGAPGGHIVIKWGKALQSRGQFQVVQIPCLHASVICPVTALKQYFAQCMLHKNQPMFCYTSGQPVTQSNVRNALATVIRHLNLPPDLFTFHAFRRSGATLAFNNNVQLQNIQVHGGWRSAAIWSYLNSTHKAAGQVARTFQAILH